MGDLEEVPEVEFLRRVLRVGILALGLACASWANPAVIPPTPEEIQKDLQLQHATQGQILPALEESSKDFLLLSDCLRMAYFNHPNLRADIQAVVEAEANLRIVDASYLPTFALTVDNTQGADPTITRVTSLEVGVTQTIWDTGQRGKKAKAARADLRAAVRAFQSTWIDQVQSVGSGYISLLEAEYIRLVQLDDVRRTKLNLDVAKAFYTSGVKSMVDVTTAQIQMSQAEVTLASSENDVRVARIALAQAMGVPVEQLEGRPLEDLLMRKSIVPSRTDALNYLAEFHPSLTSLIDQAEAEFATAEADRRANAPVLTGSAYYGNAGVYFPRAPIWQVELTLSFPFYTPSMEPTGDASEAKGQQLLEKRDAQYLLLIQQLDTAISDIQGARERAEKATLAVRQALYNGELAFRRYKYGLSEITELINARRFIETSRTELIQALSDLKTAEVSFSQAMGQIPLPPGIPEDSPFLQLNLTEDKTRDEALDKAVPHRPGPNKQ
jgi:outer membrane protein TolC